MYGVFAHAAAANLVGNEDEGCLLTGEAVELCLQALQRIVDGGLLPFVGMAVEEVVSTPERDAVDDDDTPRDVMAAQLFLFFDIGPHCAAALLMAHDTLPELFVPDVRCRKVDGMVAQAQRQLFGVDALSRTLATGNQNDFSFHGGKVTPNRGYDKAIHKD